MYPYFNGLNNYLETFIETINEKLKYNLIYFLLNLNNVIFFFIEEGGCKKIFDD